MIAIIGSLAGVLTVASFLPQIIQTYKTKKANDISLLMYMVMITGAVLWTIYGILLSSWPIIITNGSIFTFCIFIIIMKMKYK